MKNLCWITGLLIALCFIFAYEGAKASKNEEFSELNLQSHEIRKRWIQLGLTAQCGICVVKCLPKIQKLKTFENRRARSCLDLMQKGETQSGYYTIYDNKNDSVPVYCDMTSEPRSAWTLVMSWSLKNNQLFSTTPLTSNAPVNEKSPNWLLYRLSHARMHSIQSQSTHWRSTCSFPTHGVDYTDYVRGKFRDFNVLTYLGVGQCKKVEYINIRGNVGVSTTAKFWQGVHWILHTDSSYKGCPFQVLANRGATREEDNFGHYHHTNPKFRCTASAQSTTQWWFGSYL